MPLVSSKIEPPQTLPLREDVAARITRTVNNTPPPPFNPAGVQGAERVRVGTRPGRSVDMPNGLAVSFRRRQPVTGLTYYLL